MIKFTPKVVASIAGILVSGAAVVGGVQGTNTAQNTAPAPEQTQIVAPVEEKVKPKVETKIETKVISVPFETVTVDDPNLAKGQTRVDSEGAAGETTVIYEVTYTDGVETARREANRELTRAPINRVVVNGTYVAPAPAPAPTPTSTPNTSGATAVCRDGTYSYSQSRRGTCSHHGGVQSWL